MVNFKYSGSWWYWIIQTGLQSWSLGWASVFTLVLHINLLHVLDKACLSLVDLLVRVVGWYLDGINEEIGLGGSSLLPWRRLRQNVQLWDPRIFWVWVVKTWVCFQLGWHWLLSFLEFDFSFLSGWKVWYWLTLRSVWALALCWGSTSLFLVGDTF